MIHLLNYCISHDEIDEFHSVGSRSPSNVSFTYRNKTTLEVSWKAPEIWNGEPKGYQLCFSKQETSRFQCRSTNSLSYTMSRLSPATKYFVTVSAVTSAGVGPASVNVSDMTNGGNVMFNYCYHAGSVKKKVSENKHHLFYSR